MSDSDGVELTEEEQRELMDLLSSAVADVDPVPDSALRFAMESRRLIAFEAELAEIMSDSLVDGSAMRSGSGARSAVFRSGETTISVDVEDGDLSGSVDPPVGDVSVTIQSSEDAGETEVPVNERGFFSFGPVSGRFRLRIEAGGRFVVTDWFSV